jgi:Zn-dependent protease
MRGSWKIGQLFGIGVYLHWTFAVLIAWVVAAHYLQGDQFADILQGVVFVLAIFACIVAHEFGHALAARRYGIETEDITLLPIGGVARLARMPEEPWHELVVALAGPAVNLVIAAALALVVSVRGGLMDSATADFVQGDFLARLMLVNLLLAAFNLLPAFPMDGGRVLRALLATRMDYVRATGIAATIGQGMAIVFGILAPFGNLFLLFIALFVYLGAQQEAHQVQVRSLLRGVPVRAAMMTRFRTLTEEDRLPTVIDELLAGYQQDFPVVAHDQVVGVLTRNDLLTALAQRGHDVRVGDVMRRVCAVVEDGEMLDRTFQRMREADCPVLPVVRHGMLVGLLNLENVGEWMMIQSALRQRGVAGTGMVGGAA